MSADEPTKTTVALKLAGAAVLLGVSRLLFGRTEAPIEQTRSEAEELARDEGHAKRADLIIYSVGNWLVLLMTGSTFALVHWRWTSAATALGLVYALALAQALVHSRCFLHVDLKRAARDDLPLILFSTVIVCLMVGGNLVVLLNLCMRMM